MKLFAVAALVATGCGVAPPPAGSVSIALLGADGDGRAGAPLTDGQDAALIPGAQGGFHVWMGLRATGAPPGDALLARSATRLSDGALVLRSQPLHVTIDAGDGEWVQPPLPMFMCPTPIGIQVADQAITYRMALEAADGTPMAESEVTLVPRCPTDSGPTRDLCVKICFG